MWKINRFSKAYSKFDNIFVYSILTNSRLCSTFSLPLHQSSAEQMNRTLTAALSAAESRDGATADQSRGGGRANARCERSSICICMNIIWWNRGKMANTRHWGGTKSDPTTDPMPIPMYIQIILIFASICSPQTQIATYYMSLISSVAIIFIL